jgi:hypothetical protein
MNNQSLVNQKLTSQKWSHVLKKAFFDVKVEVKPVAKRLDCAPLNSMTCALNRPYPIL